MGGYEALARKGRGQSCFTSVFAHTDVDVAVAAARGRGLSPPAGMVRPVGPSYFVQPFCPELSATHAFAAAPSFTASIGVYASVSAGAVTDPV